MELKYFGTDLQTHGHYVFELKDESMTMLGLNFSGLPFHPEELTRGLEKGSVVYYQGGGFTALGIAGSCIDKRNGTKSIFWTEGNFTRNQMYGIVSHTPIASKIINQMDFKINW